MTQFPHDEFVKEYLPELCNDYGITTPSADVKSERRQIDVLFTPTKPVPTTPDTLGLLGKLAQQTCLFEVYHNPVRSNHIRECLGKLFDVQENEIRKAKRENRELIKENLPILWILTPTISENLLEKFQAVGKENWERGIYFPAAGLCTGIVAIHQLPVTRETLWLRILGRGGVQAKAIQELKDLPPNYPHRESILELVYGLLETIAANQKKSQAIELEEKEWIMSLRSIFQEKLAETEQKGIQQGIQAGIQQQRDLVSRLLKRKVGELPPELESQMKNLSVDKLQNLGEALLDFSTQEDLINWLENN